MHLVRSHRLGMLSFLRWSQTWSLTVGGTSFPQSLPWGSCTQKVWGERFPVKTEAKKLLSTPAFSLSVVTSLPVVFIEGIHFLWPSFSGWHTCRSPSYYSFPPLPNSAPATPWPAWPHPYTTVWHPCTFPRILVSALTVPLSGSAFIDLVRPVFGFTFANGWIQCSAVPLEQTDVWDLCLVCKAMRLPLV